MYTTTLTHAHTNALRAHTCTVCMHLRIQFIVDKTTCQYLHSPSPNWLWRMSITWQQHGTLMCVHCGQLSEVTRPHPCVGCGGITSNTLEAFLYYDNSICLSYIYRCWGIAYTKWSFMYFKWSCVSLSVSYHNYNFHWQLCNMCLHFKYFNRSTSLCAHFYTASINSSAILWYTVKVSISLVTATMEFVD